MDAMKMFDSNGKLPFIQEGVLKDAFYFDFCNYQPLPLQEFCKTILPEEIRYFMIPYGTANGPGSEKQCKNLPRAKYCQNYFMPFIKDEIIPDDPLQLEQRLFKFKFEDQKNLKDTFDKPLDLQNMIGLKDHFGLDNILDPSDDIDATQLLKPSDYLLGKSSYVRKFHSSLVELLKNQSTSGILRSHMELTDIDEDMIVEAILNTTTSIMISMWYSINGLSNGPGMWGYQPPFAYQGMCYPQDCSVEEIETNNRIFAEYLFKYNFLMPTIVPTPRIPDALFGGTPTNEEDLKGLRILQSTAVGCSDDEKYNGKWKPENYAVVTVLSIIGFFVSLGTLIELLERAIYITESKLDNEKNNSHGLGYKILTSFSLISNLEFIFKSPKRGGGQRLDCLEGMRAISMTWVILGHSFLFGNQLITTRNKYYIRQIYTEGIGGKALEAVKNGDFSVDSFLFIGATLLSFLLLKDLDKSNGWFHGKGIVRMILFYVNRYLRISIPYALVLLVYIGLLPLILTNPMRVHSWTVAEASCCKEFWWRKLTYSSTFGYGEEGDCCLGQTWYLCFDMFWFCLSPLVVYPLWRTKFGRVYKILGIFWWCLLMIASILATSWCVNSGGKYWEIAEKYKLPSWSFAPWGDRSMCYLIGLMTGYILHIKRDQNVRIYRLLNIIFWIVATFIGYYCVYAPALGLPGSFYPTNRKWLWGLCLSWVTFSCVKGYGGIINDLLSWGLWTPIAKVSFMTYLFHMSFNYTYFISQGYNVDVSFWLYTQIFVSQLIVDLFYGLIGCLILELPFGKIQKLLIGQLVIGK